MIFLSAGHHAEAQGAKFVGSSGNFVTEFDFTVPWADFIAELLGDKCLRVPNGALKNKVKFINDNFTGDDIAVEIHFNSAKIWKDENEDGIIDGDEMIHVGRGSETLYYPSSKKGREAALAVQTALGGLMTPNRGVKEGYYQMNPEKGPDFFLARTRCTSLIVEPEFIDNILQIQTNKGEACRIIAEALLEITSGD